VAIANHAFILVVDDEQAVRDLISIELQNAGYNVLTAVDGQDALAQLTLGYLPSLILIDHLMPNLDGVAFRTQQLLDPQLRTIPLILMTNDGQYPPQFPEKDEVNLLKKPIDPQLLIQAIKLITT
jgi:CheY-like chemotaxis protein